MFKAASSIAATKAEYIEDLKLKFKNEKPEYIKKVIDTHAKRAFTPMRTNFGMKPPTPAVVEALANLHFETTYSKLENIPAPADKWEAASTYAKFKDVAQNPFPGRPLPKRNPSLDSSLSGTSGKSVRWAEEEAEYKTFDKNEPPNFVKNNE